MCLSSLARQTSAVRVDEGVGVFLAVIIGDFLACFDRFGRKYENPVPDLARPGVRPAGVVDVSGDILPDPAGNRLAVAQIEQIAAVYPVGLLIRHDIPPIFDDKAVFRDFRNRKQAESGLGAADSDGEFAGSGLWERHKSEDEYTRTNAKGKSPKPVRHLIYWPKAQQTRRTDPKPLLF